MTCNLYVGIESGLDDVLAAVRKGHTVHDAVTQLNRLNRAGIRHCMMLIQKNFFVKRFGNIEF